MTTRNGAALAADLTERWIELKSLHLAVAENYPRLAATILEVRRKIPAADWQTLDRIRLRLVEYESRLLRDLETFQKVLPDLEDAIAEVATAKGESFLMYPAAHGEPPAWIPDPGDFE